MADLFAPISIGPLELVNRFVFPPIKTAFGNPAGEVTDRHLAFYDRIADGGPGLLILEPVAVTEEGREHPKQLTVHHEKSASELAKIVKVIHGKGRKACLHLNHAGAAANPKVIGGAPVSASAFVCPRTGAKADALTPEGIQRIIQGFEDAARKAVEAGFDAIELQAGHGYLVDQFLNPALNQREDEYGKDRFLFAARVMEVVKRGGGGLALVLRISGEAMVPNGKGTPPEVFDRVVEMAVEAGFSAVHVGMGSNCFSPPWYFHHMALPLEPQERALNRVKGVSAVPVIAAGRMGSLERSRRLVEEGRADLIALGRPLIADPDLLAKWAGTDKRPTQPCGYCLQGCLVHVADGSGIGCNFNPEVGEGDVGKSSHPIRVLVVGGGPAGLSAATYLAARGHKVTLAEEAEVLGGKALLAPMAPGKEAMRMAVEALVAKAKDAGVEILLGKRVEAAWVQELRPDLLVWAVGASPNMPHIPGMERVKVMSCVDYFSGRDVVKGKRVLVIGAGRNGLEAAEKLGKEGFEVVATKRTDTLGSEMEPISKKLCLARIEKMANVTLMPLTTVLELGPEEVLVRRKEEEIRLPAFDVVLLCAGMVAAGDPPPEVTTVVSRWETLGDARQVGNIYDAVHAGYRLALKY